MRLASIVFPFRPTFQHLELEKRWWHRLCVVIFSVMLLGATFFTAWVAYSEFAPQVSTMPQIQVGDIFDHLAPANQQPTLPTIYLDSATGERITQPNTPPNAQIDLSAGLVPKQQNQATPTFNPNEPYESASPRAAIDYDALAKKYGGISVQPMIDQQRNVHQIPMDKVIDALEAGDQRVVDMFDPKGNRGWIPEDKVQAAMKAGFKIAKPATLDSSKERPLNKSIQMPNGSTSTFAGTVSDDDIKAQWNHANTRQTLKAIMWTALITIATALFISYLFQFAYRVLLYVVFGSI